MFSLSEIPLKRLNLSFSFLKKFYGKGVHNLADLFYFFPLKYEDRRQPLSIAQAFERTKNEKNEEKESHSFLRLTCLGKGSFSFKNRSIQTFYFFDGKDEIELAAFNPSHRFFKIDEEYFVAGKVKYNKYKKQYHLTLTEWQKATEPQTLHFNRWVPIYSLTEGLTQKHVRETMVQGFFLLKGRLLSYNVPETWVQKYRLDKKLTNLSVMHFPPHLEALERARNELVYEEFYCLQAQLGKKKMIEKVGKSKDRYPKGELWSQLEKRLPFELTAGQRQCLEEIKEDLNAPAVMRRMVQGEVGSGKTMLALFALTLARDNGYQGALLAPTDVLARQHFAFFKSTLAPLGVDSALLVASNSSNDNQAIRERIRSNEVGVIIGTHSLFQKEVVYFDLKLVVIDEQHRFGVEQRREMMQKGDKVDCLMMSATPIPRSLSLAVFGDLDISLFKGPAPRQCRPEI